jgi:GcrA cell cycle regulator
MVAVDSQSKPVRVRVTAEYDRGLVIVPPTGPKPPVAPRPRPVAAAPPPPKYGRVTECSWPIGEPGTRQFHFCDSPSEAGRPYCETHARTAFVKIQRRSAPRDDGYARPEAPP